MSSSDVWLRRLGILAIGGLTSCGAREGGLAPPQAPAPARLSAARPAPVVVAAKPSPRPQRSHNRQKKAIPQARKTLTPIDWETIYDDARGYEFQIPAGSQTHHETHGNVEYFFAVTPEPVEVDVLVLAFRDDSLDKGALLDKAEHTLEELGKRLQAGEALDLSEDYSLAQGTTLDHSGVKSRVKVLVGTDVSDNYIMIVTTDAAAFKARERLIDAIWGSFVMYSGGASGRN